MPDRNFEQQARYMANGFEMKPKPEVWQNVHNAIQEPKRKRRFVLWWWVLPLGLLGGSIVLYKLNKVGKEMQELAKTNTIHQTETTKKTIQPEQLNRLQTNIGKGNLNGASAKTIILHNNSKSKHKSSKAIKLSNDITYKEEISINNFFDENATGTKKIKKSPDIIGLELSQNVNTPTPTFDNNKHINEGSVELENPTDFVIKNSLNNRSSNLDSISPATAVKINSERANRSDSIHSNKQKSILDGIGEYWQKGVLLP